MMPVYLSFLNCTSKNLLSFFAFSRHRYVKKYLADFLTHFRPSGNTRNVQEKYRALKKAQLFSSFSLFVISFTYPIVTFFCTRIICFIVLFSLFIAYSRRVARYELVSDYQERSKGQTRSLIKI